MNNNHQESKARHSLGKPECQKDRQTDSEKYFEVKKFLVAVRA